MEGEGAGLFGAETDRVLAALATTACARSFASIPAIGIVATVGDSRVSVDLLDRQLIIEGDLGEAVAELLRPREKERRRDLPRAWREMVEGLRLSCFEVGAMRAGEGAARLGVAAVLRGVAMRDVIVVRGVLSKLDRVPPSNLFASPASNGTPYNGSEGCSACEEGC